MKFNYNKLKGKIKEKYQNQKTFAKMLKINPSTLSQKLSNSIIISTSEVIIYSKKLGIPKDEIVDFFFVLEDSGLNDA